MTDYTPTAEEVRQDFAYPWEGFKQDKQGRLEAFDRWLAEHDRQIKSEALEEAAEFLSREGVLWHGDSGVTVREGWNHVKLTDWLRDRAQQLTEEP